MSTLQDWALCGQGDVVIDVDGTVAQCFEDTDGVHTWYQPGAKHGRSDEEMADDAETDRWTLLRRGQVSPHNPGTLLRGLPLHGTYSAVESVIYYRDTAINTGAQPIAMAYDASAAHRLAQRLNTADTAAHPEVRAIAQRGDDLIGELRKQLAVLERQSQHLSTVRTVSHLLVAVLIEQPGLAAHELGVTDHGAIGDLQLLAREILRLRTHVLRTSQDQPVFDLDGAHLIRDAGWEIHPGELPNYDSIPALAALVRTLEEARTNGAASPPWVDQHASEREALRALDKATAAVGPTGQIPAALRQQLLDDIERARAEDFARVTGTEPERTGTESTSG